MTIQIIIALCLWPLVVLWLFSSIGPTRGLAASVIGGFLLLPATFVVVADGLPSLNRDTTIALSCAAAVLMCAPRVLSQYRFHWMDIVVLGGLVAWGATNLANGIGMSQALLDWWWFAMFAAIPYFLGRCVLNRPSGLATLAVGIVAGTLLMVPFVMYELRMSPTLHSRVYGVQVGNGFEMARYGGWRPRVFQPAGLGMAIWLASSAVVAWSLWLSKSVTAVWRIPTAIVAMGCIAIGLLGRGGGAITLMVGGLAVLLLAHRLNKPRLVFLVPAAVALYLVTAFTDMAIPIRPLMLSFGEMVWGGSAGGSLRVRIENEAFLVASAMQKPLLGYGGWGDYRSNLELARQMGIGRVLTDGLWAIVLGQRGILGVAALYGMFLLPGVLAVNAAVRAGVGRNAIMLVLGLSLFCWLYATDLLLNAFATPVLGLTAGALTSFAMAARSAAKGRSRRAMAGRAIVGSAQNPRRQRETAEVSRGEVAAAGPAGSAGHLRD